MKQKLALACTLVHEPEIILLDEPTTGVDPVSRREFWKLLSEFLAQGITIVMATPYLDEAERCTRVGLLSNGRLLVVDTPGGLRDSLPGTMVEVIAQPQEAAVKALGSAEGVADVQPFGERIHARWRSADVRVVKAEAERALRTAAVTVGGIREIPASLEDVFIHRVAQAEDHGDSKDRT